jgi:S1-C subfamily serine protease
MTNPTEMSTPQIGRPWSDRFARARAALARIRRRAVTRIRKSAPFASGIVAALMAVFLYGVAVPGPKPLSNGDVASSIASALASVTPAPPFSELAYQAVAPSLVLIQTQGSGGPAPGSSSLPGTGSAPATSASPSDGPAAPTPAASAIIGTPTAAGNLGSGVVVDTAGDILTALHVVAGAAAIQVTFADGTTSSAQIVTTQPTNDIAVLRADKPPATLVPAVLGNPRSVQVGSEAFVLGNPFGLTGSFSAGVVSGLNRTFQLPNGTQLQGLIQVDAAINPGNSGGPLVNRYGQVIGIVSGIVNPTTQDVFIGIGFAVPIDVAGGAAGLPPD